ncbi:hypothetical protein [Modestobacter sp. URMC 112]
MRIQLSRRPLAAAPTATARVVPRLLVVLVVAGGLLLGNSGPVGAADLHDGVGTWTATLDGQNVDRLNGGQPVKLDASRPVEVALAVQNTSKDPVTVPYVQLEGRVLGLTFFAYTTQIDLLVPPGDEQKRVFDLRLLGLAEQASGLLPSRITLLDADGAPMSEAVRLQAEIAGNADSVYRVFGMAVGGLTLLLLAGVIWRLAAGRLSQDRWLRGTAMAAPGLGLGFLLTFTLSAMNVASPEPELWATLLIGGAVLGFAAGYLSPTPGGDEEDDEDAAEDLAEDRAGDDADDRSGADATAAGDQPAGTEPNFVMLTEHPADRVEEAPRSPRWRS